MHTEALGKDRETYWSQVLKEISIKSLTDH